MPSSFHRKKTSIDSYIFDLVNFEKNYAQHLYTERTANDSAIIHFCLKPFLFHQLTLLMH
jgi:hypothetical protein